MKKEYPELEGTINLCNDMINKKQTAVEWLLNNLHKIGVDYNLSIKAESGWLVKRNEIIEQAKQIEKEQQQIITDKITRFEVIDHTSEKLGRILVRYGVSVEVSIQDDGRTMKVFLTDKTNEQ